MIFAWFGGVFLLFGLMVGFSAYADDMGASLDWPATSNTVSEASAPRRGCEGVIFRDEDPACFAFGGPASFSETSRERTAGPVLLDFLTNGRQGQS